MTRMIATLLILTLTLSFSGCGLGGFRRLVDKNRNVKEDPILPNSKPVSTDADPRIAIIEAYNRLCEARSYRLKSVRSGSIGESTVTKVEYAAPNRVRSIHYAGTEIETEFIMIGSRYFERSKGKWSEVPNRFGEVDLVTKCELENGRPAVPGYVETELKLIGPETVNGVKVLTYRSRTDYQSIDGPDSLVAITSIGVSDGRLYRVDVKWTTNPSLRHDTLTEYSDYDTDISIEAPI